MALLDSVRTRLVAWLFPDEIDARAWRALQEQYTTRFNYARGIQRRQLAVKIGQADDNISINFVGLVIERSISMLFGKPIKFDLSGEGESQEDIYIKSIWDKNKQQILLHKVAQFGSMFGTC